MFRQHARQSTCVENIDQSLHILFGEIARDGSIATDRVIEVGSGQNVIIEQDRHTTFEIATRIGQIGARHLEHFAGASRGHGKGNFIVSLSTDIFLGGLQVHTIHNLVWLSFLFQSQEDIDGIDSLAIEPAGEIPWLVFSRGRHEPTCFTIPNRVTRIVSIECPHSWRGFFGHHPSPNTDDTCFAARLIGEPDILSYADVLIVGVCLKLCLIDDLLVVVSIGNDSKLENTCLRHKSFDLSNFRIVHGGNCDFNVVFAIGTNIDFQRTRRVKPIFQRGEKLTRRNAWPSLIFVGSIDLIDQVRSTCDVGTVSQLRCLRVEQRH